MQVLYELSIDGGRYVDGLIDATLSHPEIEAGSMLKGPRVIRFNPALFVSGPHRGLLEWAATTMNKQVFRKNLVVKSMDLQSGKSFSQTLSNCLLADIVLPALDRSSSADAYLQVTVVPERIETIAGNTGVITRSSRQWKVRDFRLSIDSIDTDVVTSVSAVTVKQGIAYHYSGQSTLPDIETRAKLEERNLTLAIPNAKAGGVMAWHRAAMTTAAGALGRKGSLEYLSPQKKALMRVDFEGLVPVSIKQSGTNTILELAMDSVTAESR